MAWVRQERWDALTAEQRRKFAPICPDFVAELRSPSDDITDIRAKMLEYLENGIQLGWLIDPESLVVEIYRPNQLVETRHHPSNLSSETILPGFILDLNGILT